MEMAAKDIERLGGTVEMVDIGKQKVWQWELLSFFSLFLFSPSIIISFGCVSFPLEKKSPCHPLSWAAWGLTQTRRQCVSMVISMSSQPVLMTAGIQSLSLWWKKTVNALNYTLTFVKWNDKQFLNECVGCHFKMKLECCLGAKNRFLISLISFLCCISTESLKKQKPVQISVLLQSQF